jgi:predicted secreted Zn-dependent protease
MANPAITVTTNHYTITGSTASELRQQMNQLGPLWRTGKRFDAITRWHVRWSYRYAIRNNRCQITTNQVQADITITMPQWRSSSQVSGDLVKRWQRYITALQHHENGHRDHGIGAAREVVRALSKFPASPTCQQLGLAADAAMLRIIDRYSRKDVEYDRLTQHGATQGAKFP